MNLCIRNCMKPNVLKAFLRSSYSTASTIEAIEASDQVLIEDDTETALKEAEIEAKRNKSRLTTAHFNLVNGRRPYDTPRCLAHKTVKYNRKLYGKYGIASGINPSICWPSQRDITEQKEYESIAYPYTIQQMMDMAAEKRQREKAQIQEREQELAIKFAKLELWKKELTDRVSKKTREATAAKEKKERLVEEVRRHFGFKLDPRDERFQEMLTKREKEQKKQEKLAKREAKEKTMLTKLQQQNSEIGMQKS